MPEPTTTVMPGWCSLCEWDVWHLFDHHLLHFEQWDMERLFSFMAGVDPNVCHSRALLHPLAHTQGACL